MDVSIINCSTRFEGRTNSIVNAFSAGMEEVGNINIYRHDLTFWNLEACQGCSHCWFKNPGQCKLNDDFTKHIKDITASDILIFTSPIWVGSATYLFKKFVERLFCIGKPDFIMTRGHYGHNLIQSSVLKKMLVISNCALPGKHNFTPFIEHVKALEYLCNLEFSGCILKDQSLELLLLDTETLNDFYQLCRKAGKEFLTDPESFKTTADKILIPMIETNKYISMCNQLFHERLQKNSLNSPQEEN